MEEEKLKKLSEYYKNNGLLIVGLNDSQGVNTNSTFFRKGLLEYLAAALTTEEFKPQTINAFSLLMNKTEHIDYFLQGDLNLQEIKLSQIYSAVSAFEKIMSDLKLPKCLGQIGNLYRVAYPRKETDHRIFLTSSLKQAIEPTLIYSSGVNNLMREAGSNPFAIQKDYKMRHTKPNYDYVVAKVQDPQTLLHIMDGIKQNFETILSINGQTDIYVLGAYIPKSFHSEGMNLFCELTHQYNAQLQQLCEEYQSTFIDTDAIGNKYNQSQSNFHISNAGHNRLANFILGYMYHKKIETLHLKKEKKQGTVKIDGTGPSYVYQKAMDDFEKSYNTAQKLQGYEAIRELAIAEEHLREAKVFKKVLEKTQ